MRIDCRQLDAEGRPNPLIKHVQVLLDGQLCERCVMADEEAGTVECFVVGPNGRNRVANGEPVTEIRHGAVRIVPAHWQPQG